MVLAMTAGGKRMPTTRPATVTETIPLSEEKIKHPKITVLKVASLLGEAIADDVGTRRGIEVRTSQVVVGPGGKPALFFPTLALVEAGDEVIYPDDLDRCSFVLRLEFRI